MVRRLKHFLKGHLHPRRMLTIMMTKAKEALWFVESKPPRYTIGVALTDNAGEVGKPVSAISIQPASLIIQGGGKVPVE